MPKSSIASRMPEERSISVTVAVAVSSCMAVDSVTSMTRSAGRRPKPRMVDSTCATVRPSHSVVGKLKPMSSSIPAVRQASRWRQTCSITQSVIGAISPVRSARGMNASGGIGLPNGSRHRSSASTPIIRRVAGSNTGW